MAYTFTASNGAVLITNTSGYNVYWQGFTNISIAPDGAHIILKNTQRGTISFTKGEITSIGGVAPAATTILVAEQLNILFNTAYKQNGGGGGSTPTLQAVTGAGNTTTNSVTFAGNSNTATGTDGLLVNSTGGQANLWNVVSGNVPAGISLVSDGSVANIDPSGVFGLSKRSETYFTTLLSIKNGGGFKLIFDPAALTANRTITWANKGGTPAMISDVTLQQATTGGATNQTTNGIVITGNDTPTNTDSLTLQFNTDFGFGRIAYETGVAVLCALLLDAPGVTIVNESGFGALLATSGLTADRTLTIQNASGTVAYTTDITTALSSYINTATRTVTSAATLSISAGGFYIFSGTTATWTLPAVGLVSGSRSFFMKNRGTGTVTINSNSGGNDIYAITAVNTLSLLAGESVTLYNDGTYFSKMT